VVLVSELLHEPAGMSRPAGKLSTFYTRHSDGGSVFQVSVYVNDEELAGLERARMTLGVTRSGFVRMAIKLLVEDVEPDAATNGR
jgi:hypothetical protein